MIDLRGLVEQSALQALAWTLLHFIWQGALLGFASFLLLRVVRPQRASTRYTIGVISLLLMLATSVATFFTLVRQQGATLALPTTAATEPATTTQGSNVTGWVIADLNASPTARALLTPARDTVLPLRSEPLGPFSLFAIVTIWSIGVLALSFRLVGGWVLTRHLTRRAVDHVSPAIERAAQEIS